MVNHFDYKGIEFAFSKKDYEKIEQNIFINVFCCKNDLVYPFHTSKQKCENCIELLLINNENKSHYVYFKDFTDLCLINTKHKT